MTTVLLNPTFDVFYHSFYIQGLIEVFGRSGVRYSSKPFPSSLPAGCLALIVKGRTERRIIVDAYDGAVLTNYNSDGLEWCDVYGKVNLALPLVPEEQAHKCVPIGPSFPIRLWGPLKSAWAAVKNYRASVNYQSRLRGINSSREHFANYGRQYKHALPPEYFHRGQTRDDYIFFLSSLWNEEQAPGTNEFRARFIECCRALHGVTFEGGLVSSDTETSSDLGRFANYVVVGRVPLQEWFDKTKSSAVVFNTPAVWSCHGFKLGEFLALGKAIISTPLTRDLPAPLIHGVHIHYVDGSLDSIRDAVQLLLKDREYRNCLEQNAYHYYQSHLSPKRVVDRLLAFADN